MTTRFVRSAAVSALFLALLAPTGAMQTPNKIDTLIAQMTLDEKISMLHGAQEPAGGIGQAGYLPGVPRLGIPPLRLTDGPAGVRTQQPATAMPAPVSLASTFDPSLARLYGQVLGRDARARNQDVLLAPMVNIVRVPQGGRDFETLGEDPFLASRMVASEVSGVQAEHVIATVKHFAENNQENQRQSVSADVDEQTMHEIELPGFEAAVKAGVGSVMAAYNKVNGAWASENAPLQNDILRKLWNFQGFVMSDWGATHSGTTALTNGLDMEMPGGQNFNKIPDAIKAGQLKETVVNQAVRRILVQMDKVGLLDAKPLPRPPIDVEADAKVAKDVAVAGAVLLKNDRSVLPLGADDFKSLAVIGPTAKAILVGGGGSARVLPFHTGKPIDALTKRAGAGARISYAIGYDTEGVPAPLSNLSLNAAGAPQAQPVMGLISIVPLGSQAIAAGTSSTWKGTLTAAATGDYELKLQTLGGRGSLQIDPPPPASPAAGGGAAPAGAGRGGRGGGGGAGLLPTTDGLTNATTPVHWEAGSAHQVVVTGNAGATAPMQIRLNWIVPGWRETKIAEAVATAKAAHTVVLFAYDEGSEGRDRASLALLGYQDALIQAVAAANPRTVVVLSNGAPVTMPWANDVAAILQVWYPGQEGAEATAALLSGDANPGGRLPVTFPKRVEDAPTNMPERYPGVNGHGAYSEGLLVGYRWYDAQNIEPLFPFGHGLSYTTFSYTNLRAKAAGDGCDVSFVVKNTGARAGSDVPQLYLGPPPTLPAPMAPKQLVGFERVTLAPGASKTVTLHVDARELSYWSVATHGWVVASGSRQLSLGASSRDVRLKTDVIVERR